MLHVFRAAIVVFAIASMASAVDLRVASFNVDATPPVGSPLGGASVPNMRGISDPLSARGVVLLPEGDLPVVLCAVDWIGIANGSHTAWRQALADAAGTTIERVSVHTLHQHDAPFADRTVEALLAEQGMGGLKYHTEFAQTAIDRAAAAVTEAIQNPTAVTHLGVGKAKVEKVASNRRLLGPDGKVAHVRWTATADPELRAAPEGVIDPWMRAVSFWNGDEAVAVMTYYATHPQSYYRTGLVSTDFPGIARAQREEDLPRAAHIHFNGAGGNIGAGKYNDGAEENRAILAGRMHAGMRDAFRATEKHALAELDFDWKAVDVVLPAREDIDLAHERARLVSDDVKTPERMQAAREIAWKQRVVDEDPISLGRLEIGPLQIVHLPGELFVEYQLAAQDMAPDSFVCTAAYSDYGPGYIGTAEAYPQGGYETGLYTSRTAPEVEGVLMNALKQLLTD